MFTGFLKVHKISDVFFQIEIVYGPYFPTSRTTSRSSTDSLVNLINLTNSLYPSVWCFGATECKVLRWKVYSNEAVQSKFLVEIGPKIRRIWKNQDPVFIFISGFYFGIQS